MKKNLFNPQNTKKLYQQFLLLLILFFSGNVWGQTTIASEGFNNSSSSFTVSGGAYYTGNSASGDRPATSAFAVEGSHSYGFTAPSTTTASATLTSVNFNTVAYTGLSLSFRLAAFSIGSTGNGVDGTDLVNVEISPDGGTTYYSTIRVLGSSNAYWAYSATGVASTAYDGNVTPVDFQPTTSGSQTTAGYSTVTITGLPSVSNLKVRITLTNNATSERWVVDDFKLTGTSASSCTTPTSQPTNLVYGTTSASTVNATFTGVASPNTPSGYLILRSTSATAPTLVDGTSYTTNTDATIGGIVYRVLQGSVTASLGTTIAETGLASNTKYYYYIYSFNNNCTGQPYYLTTSPLTGDKTTCPAPATLPLSSVTNNSATVSWTASAVGGSAETIKYRFELYSDSGRTTPVSGYPLTDTTSPVNITSGLTVNTNYYYRIIAYNSSCQSTNLDGSFYNGVCIPGTTNNTSYYISNFTTTKGYSTNINKTSTYVSSGYQDNYSTDKVEMYPTGSFDFSYTTVGSQLGTSIWVDWNNDWVFDTSERVFTTTATGTAGGNGTITVPAGKALGDYRMRVRTERYASSPDNPCSSAFTAETEDYKISVVAQPDYVIYTDATTANNTVNNTLNIYFKDFDGYNNFYTNDQLEIWMHAGIKTSSANWQYQNAGQDFNNTSTLIKFTRESTNPNVYKATVKLADWFCIPTGTIVEGLNLVFRNQYGVGGNNQTADMVLNLTSATVAVNVSTIGAASAVTTNSATISWTAPTTGAVKGFDYYYSTSNIAPTAGTTPSGTVAGNVYTANLSSLSPATTYYFWVRTKGCDTNSAWSASGNFTTACAVVIAPTVIQTFDTYLPPCWAEATGAVTSSSVLSGTTSRWDTSANFGNGTGSNKGVKINLYGTNNDWLISNQIDLGTTPSQYRVSYKMAVTSYNGTTAQSTIGTHQVRLIVSTDGGTTWSNTNVVKTYTGEAAYTNTGTIEHVNLIGYSGIVKFAFVASTTSTSPDLDFHLDDFIVETIPPTLLANNASMASLSFADQAITTTSTTQSFNLSGLMLTGAPGTINISAPAGFEVSSVDNTTWGTSTTVSYTSATLVDKQVNVRFKPTDCTSISNAVLTISGGGATVIPTVTLSGKGIIPAPTANAGTDITATTFTANWQPVSGASGYVIDVYKKDIRPNATDLFISEYVHGSSNEKYVEIFNGTGADVDLSNYRLRLYANGSSSTTNDVLLSGILSNNSVIVYRNNLSTLYSGASTVNAAMNFNGDDALSLYKISTASNVDIFGRIGNDPGTAWTGADGYTTLSKTLVRKSSVLGGVTISPTGTGASAFTTLNSEWNMFNVDTVSNLGAHSFDGGTIFTQVLHNQTTGNVTSYNVTGLDANTMYHYVVRAISSSCESVNSNEIAVTTNNTVIWNGSAWSNTDGPTASLDSKITGAYSIPKSFETNNLEITNTGSLDIKAQKDVTVQGNITLPADNKIVVESDANLVQTNVGTDNNSNNIITVKRTALLPTKGYTFWSSPVASQNLYSFSNGYNSANGGTGTGTPWNRFFVYKESTDTFVTAITGDVTLGASSVFDTARGYAIRGKNSYTPTGGTGVEIPALADEFSFTGKMHNGNLSSQTLKNSCDSTVLEANCTKGYNLIGNPYPSNIDFDALYNANNTKIYGTAYFWTNNDITATASQAGSNYSGNNYAIYNLTGGTPAVEIDPDQGVSASPIPNGIVKVGQGFIVKAKKIAAGSPVDFTNAMRVGYDADAHFYNAKKAQKNRFWLKMTAPTNIANTVLVGYIPEATNDFEIDYDGELFVIGSDAFYSILPNKKLAIQGKADFTTEDVVSLGTKHAVSGSYKISLGKKEGLFAENQKIYLRDKQTGLYTDLTIQDYLFNATQGSDDNRFEIVYKKDEVLGTDSVKNSDFTVYRDGDNFVVRSSNNLGKIELYDVTGKLMQSNYYAGKVATFDASALISGVYIIKAENSGNIRTKKIIK